MQAALKDREMKTVLLEHPADWFIDGGTLEAAKATIPAIHDFVISEGKDDLGEMPLKDIIKQPLPDVYTLPLFSKEFCDILMDEIKDMDFTPNGDEDELRQIPEVVLQERYPKLHLSLMTVVRNVMNPIFFALWQRIVISGGIQIANYNIKDKDQGAWHHDLTSDISVVVPLNTGEYKGGGTEFKGRGIIEPIPNGNALIFPSFTHMHRGLPLIDGDRYLLVFWLNGGSHEQN